MPIPIFQSIVSSLQGKFIFHFLLFVSSNCPKLTILYSLPLSGLLVGYAVFKELRRFGRLNYFQFYLHRYIRMTPLMMIIIGFCVTLLKYMGSGPTWVESTTMFDKWCQNNWWINSLYLHNFINRENMVSPLHRVFIGFSVHRI